MDTKAKTGYVYILTNPSFREDWVKIGKSSRPVDVRSKELDNTAVPLPFEIYATLQTAKYNEVEKLVHKTIDRLTDLRIRQNREFFNVRPEVAMEILKDIASTLDDAVINSYNHGNIIHVASRDEDKEADKTSGVRKQKDAFWAGYIEEMRHNPLFNDNFRLHESIPRYSYDLPLGTSLCNLFQTANRKKVTVGLYFHGKEQFLALSPYRNDIDRMIGAATEWTEFDKDASIVVSKDFDLEDAASYKKTYAWMLDLTVMFKNAYNKTVANLNAQIAPSQENETDDDHAMQARPGQRPPFRFSMVGIEIGEELTFTPTGIKVRVASDNQIEYEGRLYKLSPFTGTFMPEEKRNNSGAYQGAKFFTYKGRTLDDLRTEKESL